MLFVTVDAIYISIYSAKHFYKDLNIYILILTNESNHPNIHRPALIKEVVLSPQPIAPHSFFPPKRKKEWMINHRGARDGGFGGRLCPRLQKHIAVEPDTRVGDRMCAGGHPAPWSARF
jgi:hypothetical protein